MADRPTDADVVSALRVIAAALGIGDSASSVLHDQDNLPSGERSKDHYLRLHRERVKVGTPGWTRHGKKRLVTAVAWEAELEAETSRSRARPPKLALVAPPAANESISKKLDAALGIRTRAAR